MGWLSNFFGWGKKETEEEPNVQERAKRGQQPTREAIAQAAEPARPVSRVEETLDQIPMDQLSEVSSAAVDLPMLDDAKFAAIDGIFEAEEIPPEDLEARRAAAEEHHRQRVGKDQMVAALKAKQGGALSTVQKARLKLGMPLTPPKFQYDPDQEIPVFIRSDSKSSKKAK